MDHDFAMQPHVAPGAGTSFSRSHLPGRPARPSKLPGGVSPLIPVLKKTIHLDAFPQSHIPQASGRPGLGARAWSVPPQETGKSLAPRKLSSISLTVRQHSQSWRLGPLPSHWEQVSTPGREAATHRGGRLPSPDSPPVTLVPGDRVHSEGPGHPGLAKPSRVPAVEKPLVSSCLTLPFQSRLAQGPPGPAGPRLVGQRHPVPMTAHVPTRASPGRGKPRPRGIQRPRLHLQRAIPATGPATAMHLAALDATRPGTSGHSSTMATNRPGLAVHLATPNTSRLDTSTEFPPLDSKLGSAMDLAKAGTTKPRAVTDAVTPDPEKLGKAIATAGTGKPDTTTEGTAREVAAPDPGKLDTALVLAGTNRAKLDMTTGSLVLDTSRLGTAMHSAVPVTPDPVTGETTLDSVIKLTRSDTVTYPSMPSRSTDAALDHATADAATDWVTALTMLDLARETKVIEEGGVKMKLTVIDTPGFGDQINNENCWEPIEKYINEQYEKFLKEEVNIARKKRIPDTRVHCCLYFISPTGHSLRPLDLEFMKHLSKVVNIIPVIAKADTMTLEEKSEFKQRVRKELEVNGIEFYPQKEFDEDLEDKTENDKIRQESMPFAVVGSDKEYQVNGKRVLGRKTPWGIIEVENLNHCEFALLRDFVIRTHLQDLKEVTHNIHYETYRAKRLNDNGGLPPGEGLLGIVLPPVPATPCPTAE
ncbi:neuronal-specific septin-3 isoform X4 [Globicephala melas]|uniref:neuronal-specific septin-3 isoform X4 n=1 Tax=Globicephala melas TaxID=9731 RepID=UPI00293D6070|nr:neuronal-specific septin-3 isoform X4 [Globicephala melas]